MTIRSLRGATTPLVLLFAVGCAHSVDSMPPSSNPPPSNPPPTMPATPVSCSFHAAAPTGHAVLVYGNADGVEAIRDDGSQGLIYTFTVPPGTNGTNGGTIDAHDGFILAARSWATGDPYAVPAEEALLDASGTVRWHRTFTGPMETATLGPDGTAVFVGYTQSNGTYTPNATIVQVDGTTSNFVGVQPVGTPGPNGDVAVSTTPQTGESPTPIAWIRSGASSVQPMSHTLAPYSSPTWCAGSLLFASSDAGLPVIIAAQGGTEHVIALPGVAADAAPQLISSSGDLALAWDRQHDARWRIDGRSFVATAWQPAYPSGERAWMFGPEPQLDASGNVLTMLRNTNEGQLYASPDGVDGWTAIGRPVWDILQIDLATAGGTHVIRGTNAVYGGEMWPGAMPSADAVSMVTQIVRPSTGADYVIDAPNHLEAPMPTLSADGGCAVWTEPTEAGVEIHALDVGSGDRSVVAMDSTSTFVSMAFVGSQP